MGALRGTVPTLAEEPETPTLVTVGVVGRSAEPYLRSLRRLWEGSAFALPREGMGLFASKARYGPVPLPLGFPRRRSLVGRVSGPGVRFQPMSGWGCVGEVVGRSAEPYLRSLRRLWEGSAFALPREGMGLFASKARYGPVPLPLGLPRKRSLVGRVS